MASRPQYDKDASYKIHLFAGHLSFLLLDHFLSEFCKLRPESAGGYMAEKMTWQQERHGGPEKAGT